MLPEMHETLFHNSKSSRTRGACPQPQAQHLPIERLSVKAPGLCGSGPCCSVGRCRPRVSGTSEVTRLALLTLRPLSLPETEAQIGTSETACGTTVAAAPISVQRKLCGRHRAYSEFCFMFINVWMLFM